MIGAEKVVSLDVDGTLYDAAAFRRAFVLRMGRGILSTPLVTLGDALRIWRFHRAAAAVRRERSDRSRLRLRLRSNAAQDSLRRCYGGCLAAIGPRQGIRRLITTLRHRGTVIVAVTDYICDYKLEALGLGDIVDGRIEGEVLGTLKPDPEIFRRLTQRLGVRSGDVLHIGDRADRDGAAARDAGIRCLLIGRDFTSFVDMTSTA